VKFTEADTGRQRQELVAYFLLARVANFGRIFKGVAPGAALTREDATLILFKTPQRTAYIRFATAVLLGTKWSIPGVESVQVRRLEAELLNATESVPPEWRGSFHNEPLLRAEVDGEVVGTLPVRHTIMPNAITVLFPRN
jgi:diacylglycerol kinase family enzyme